MKRLRIRALALACVAGSGAAISWLAAGALGFQSATPALAIPGMQAACNTVGTSVGDSWVNPAGAQVTINDGTVTRNVILTASGDANVPVNSEMRSGWTIDSSSPPAGDYLYGPGNFAEHQDFDGTRTSVNVVTIGSGTHTIRFWLRMTAPNVNGILDRYCVTAEGKTS